MTAVLPGLTVEVVATPAASQPLRTDIAGFLGAARKGPVGVPVRVDGQTAALRIFGGYDPASDLAYALRGYFENDGDVAWVVRLSGPADTASARWEPGPGVLPASVYEVRATSPGEWANRLEIRIWFRPQGLTGQPELDVRVTAGDGAVEYFEGLSPATLGDGLTGSALVRFVASAETTVAPRPLRRSATVTLTLTGGTDSPPGLADYQASAEALAEQPEVALVAAPDLYRHLTGDDDREAAVDALLGTATETLDRLIVLDVPPEAEPADLAAAWVTRLRARHPDTTVDAAAYHPRLLVPDPLGTVADPLRAVPACGHVTGVISRLDRALGPHHTPANAILNDAIDFPVPLDDDEKALLYRSGINVLRCLRGRGLQVWGGRTPEFGPGTGRSGFVAHRRLLHQLVRAARTVATPLVFDVNSAELRLTVVRAVTSVLLQAFRSGALRGARPAEAFRVRCDGTNNPPGQDPGLVVCEIDVAVAAPMEFIRLRLLLGAEGRLEVREA